MHAWLTTSLLLFGATQPQVPTLARAPQLDGQLKDFPATLTLSPPAPASFKVRVGERQGTLYAGIEVEDDVLQTGDEVTLSLQFPGAGPTATGHTFRLAFDGKRASSPEETGTPAFAQEWVQAAVKRTDSGQRFEVAIPARALPRFPAQGPLLLDLCVAYEDQDAVGVAPQQSSTCKAGVPLGGSLKLSDGFRKALQLKPPSSVESLQGQPGGWLGFGALHFPSWVQADQVLKPESLRALVKGERAGPAGGGLTLPEALNLPDGRPLVTVLSGEDPYAMEGECNSERELRLALYVVKGKQAQRALEWPAATCALGRALSVAVNEEGALTIGYSNGATITFAWSGDHFERTEIGKR